MGSCIAECPKKTVQDEGILKESNHGYFEYLNDCLTNCPEETYEYGSYCLKECPENHTYSHNEYNRGICVPCGEQGCPKTCYGVAHSEWIPAVRKLGNVSNISYLDLNQETDLQIFKMKHETVNSHNIGIFEDCELVVGSLVFQVHTFTDQERDIPALTWDDLAKLRSIKRIMGYLSIDFWPFESFDVFEKLEVIYGQHNLFRDLVALFLASNRIGSGVKFPQVHEFGLKSLRSIENGNVAIMANEFSSACHIQTIQWERFIKRPMPKAGFRNGLMVERGKQRVDIFKELKENDQCKNFQCHEECKNGCWGDGNLACIECRNFVYMGDLKGTK